MDWLGVMLNDDIMDYFKALFLNWPQVAEKIGLQSDIKTRDVPNKKLKC
jgi:hypothetical protein